MATIDCREFDRTLRQIDRDRRAVRDEAEAGKARLSEIASEIRSIDREIARLASNLMFLERLRSRSGRRLSDDLGDAHRLLSFEDARRKIAELEERKRELEREAAEIRRKLANVDSRLTDLRNGGADEPPAGPGGRLLAVSRPGRRRRRCRPARAGRHPVCI
jgi:chromosome segregation ATPase